MVIYLGSLVQLCCGEGGTLQTNITGMCGECWQCLGHTGFSPFSWSVCFPGLRCSGTRLLCWGIVKGWPWVVCNSQIYATQFQVLGYSTKAQIRLGLCFVPFPGPSSSADQVLGECTLSSWVVHLIISLVPATRFPGCSVGAQSQVCHASSLGC